MSNDDWKKTLPFKQHWLIYVLLKFLVLALAAGVGLHLIGYF